MQAQRQTQVERKAESERLILAAAVELFAKQGYKNTTVSQVAALSGYSAGLVSHRFGSKFGLLVAVIKWVAENLLEARLLPASDTATAREAILNYVRVCIKELKLNPTRVRAMYVLVGEGLTGEPEVQSKIMALNVAFRQVFTDLIHRGIESGEFSAMADAEDIAGVIVAVLRGVVLLALLDPKQFDPGRLTPIVEASVAAALPIN